jgi:hypothetical protein
MGSVGTHLREGLQKRLARPVRVFNLAFPCQNSRDSLFKYRHLVCRHFDLVLAYDGINDMRMNNAPPGKFCDDYSHCSWYANLNFLETHPWLSRATLPFALHFIGEGITEELGLVWHVNRHYPNRQEMEWPRTFAPKPPSPVITGRWLRGRTTKATGSC